jgi:hypothetical protein
VTFASAQNNALGFVTALVLGVAATFAVHNPTNGPPPPPTNDFRNGFPITLPHEFGTIVLMPHEFGNLVTWLLDPAYFGNLVTWFPDPAHFGNEITDG